MDVDTQLHMTVAAALVLLWWALGAAWGAALVSASTLGLLGVGGYVVAAYELRVGQLIGGNGPYYVKPWTRAPAYLCGLLLGGCIRLANSGNIRSSLRTVT